MEEEAPSRRSVAELAGRFKGSAPPHEPAGQEAEKPVRRRPPRSLKLPKTNTEDEELPAGVTSPLPAKAKRNSGLIEKLQANLALSPTALLPSPKSPGYRLLPPTFPPQSPSSAPVTAATTTASTPTPISPVAASPVTEEEGPASFEAPPSTAEGSILTSINKDRARHSIRRRPPSRRHRKSSCGDDVVNSSEGRDTSPSTPSEQNEGTREGEEKTEEKADEVKEKETETTSTKCETHKEEGSEINAEPREEDKKEEEGESRIQGGGEGDGFSSGGEKKEEEEKNSAEKPEEGGAPTNTNSREEEKSEETTCESSTS